MKIPKVITVDCKMISKKPRLLVFPLYFFKYNKQLKLSICNLSLNLNIIALMIFPRQRKFLNDRHVYYHFSAGVVSFSVSPVHIKASAVLSEDFNHVFLSFCRVSVSN